MYSRDQVDNGLLFAWLPRPTPASRLRLCGIWYWVNPSICSILYLERKLTTSLRVAGESGNRCLRWLFCSILTVQEPSG